MQQFSVTRTMAITESRKNDGLLATTNRNVGGKRTRLSNQAALRRRGKKKGGIGEGILI